MTAVTLSSMTNLINVTVVYNHQPVLNSMCHISSLEVYRGRDHVTRIMHDGFLLSDSGRVEASIQLTIVMELTMIHVLILRLTMPAWRIILRNILESSIAWTYPVLMEDYQRVDACSLKWLEKQT